MAPHTPDNRPPSPQKKKNIQKKRPSFLWTLSKVFLTVGIWLFCAACLGILWFSYDLPSVKQLQESHRKPSVVIQSEAGEVLATYGDLHANIVRIQELPPYVYQSVLAIEDRRFFHHFGLDVIGLVRAAYENYRANRVVQGGSTITQQLGKNFLQSQGLYTVNDRSLRRKVQEAIMALWLEWNFTKEQILTIYLNRVYLGAGTYGIDAAAQKYFNTTARNLNVYQAAIIAGLLKAPSRYSPLSHPERALERGTVVLNQMAEEGYIQNPTQYINAAKKDLLKTRDDRMLGQLSNVKFFTDWIYDQLSGYVPMDQDLIVTTTLDPVMQRHMEKICAEHAQKGADFKASEVSMLTMTKKGAVKAMMGGYNYRKSQFNRATQALRQSGSTFKLFVYLAGLEYGFRPDTLFDDSPIHIGNWSPSSFKWRARGEITMREGFAYSVNPVTVRIGHAVGPKKILDVAHRLGITSEPKNNLSITLGAMDTTLLQLVSAFATFANKGLAVWPYGILEIKNRHGDTLYKRKEGKPVRVVARHHFENMHSMLNSVVSWGTGRAAKSAQGGKSGSNGDRDAWFIGYTPDGLVSGVWIGNDDCSPMVKKSVGGRLPTWIWEAYHSTLPQVLKEQGTPYESVDDLIDTFTDNENLDDGEYDPRSYDPPAPETLSDEDLDNDRIVESLIETYGDIPATEEMPVGFINT